MFRKAAGDETRRADARRKAAHPPKDRRPDQRRAPAGPDADRGATDHAIERLFAVLGR